MIFDNLMKTTERAICDADRVLITANPKLSKYEKRRRSDELDYLRDQIVELYNEGYSLEEMDELIRKRDELAIKEQSLLSRLCDRIERFVEKHQPYDPDDVQRAMKNEQALKEFKDLSRIRGADRRVLMENFAKGLTYFPSLPDHETLAEIQRQIKEGDYPAMELDEETAYWMGLPERKEHKPRTIKLENLGRAVTSDGYEITDKRILRELFPEYYMGWSGGESRPANARRIISGLTDVPYKIRGDEIVFEKRLPNDVYKKVRDKLGDYFAIRQPKSGLHKAAAIGVLAAFGLGGVGYALAPNDNPAKQGIKRAGGKFMAGLAGLPIVGDHDGDGIPNYKDPHPNVHEDNFKDFDGDGIPNYKDPHPNVHEDNFDGDGDGIPDYKDPHPNIPEEEWNLKHTDSDGDGMSDWFEKNIANLDPNAPNDRYAILCVDGYPIDIEHGFVAGSYSEMIEIYDFLINQYRIPSDNLIKISKSTYHDFKDAVDQIAKKADENDLVYVMMVGDGNLGIFSFSSFSDRKVVTYEEIDNLLDKINAKAVVVTVDACHSGSAIPFLKDGPCPRVVMTQCRDDQVAGGARTAMYFFESLGNPFYSIYGPYPGRYNPAFSDSKIVDTDGNGFISVKEGLDYAKEKIMSEWIVDLNNYEPCEPQISDPDNIASGLYLGEYKPEKITEK